MAKRKDKKERSNKRRIKNNRLENFENGSTLNKLLKCNFQITKELRGHKTLIIYGTQNKTPQLPLVLTGEGGTCLTANCVW